MKPRKSASYIFIVIIASGNVSTLQNMRLSVMHWEFLCVLTMVWNHVFSGVAGAFTSDGMTGWHLQCSLA
jgi:hypothetical protein